MRIFFAAALAAFVLPNMVQACEWYVVSCGVNVGMPRQELIVHSWSPGMNIGSPYSYQYQPSFYPQQYYEPYYSGYASQSLAYYPMPHGYPPYSPQPTGMTNLWGEDLCNWGPGYSGYPCGYDPHQWVYDPYTGTYY